MIAFNAINYNKESGVNLEFTLPFKHNYWSSTNNFNFIFNKVEDQSAVYTESKPYLYYYSNHIFELPNLFDFSVTGWGFTKREGVEDLKVPLKKEKSLSVKNNYPVIAQNRTNESIEFSILGELHVGLALF